MVIALLSMHPLVASIALLISGAAVSEGMISKQAQSIGDTMRWRQTPQGLLGEASFSSPDRRSTLQARFVEQGNEGDPGFAHFTEFRLTGAAGAARFRGNESLGDVLWSPDSRKVAVSLSDGGLNGIYRLLIVHGGKARERTELFRRAFPRPKACDLGGAPNVGALTWLSATHLIVVVQPPWEERCAGRGTVAYFDYDVAGDRFHRITPKGSTLRRYRAMLGTAFRR